MYMYQKLSMKFILNLFLSVLIFSASISHGKIQNQTEFIRAVTTSLELTTIDSKPVNYLHLEQTLEKAIAQDPSLAGPSKEVAVDVAEQYLMNGRIQEAIWALEKGGSYYYAEVLTNAVEKYLSELPIIKGKYIGKGISGSFFGKINDRIAVVIKPRDQAGSVESEIWSYQLDRMIGTNLVPVAVKRQLGDQVYSIHLIVNGAKDSGLNFRNSGYQQAHSDIYFLDYMIDQIDRHHENSMIGPNGKLFAIDHGRVFGTNHQNENGVKHRFLDTTFIPSSRVLNNIKNANVDKIKLELAKYAPEAVVRFITKRLLEVQSKLQDPVEKTPVRFVLAAERLQDASDKKSALDAVNFKKLIIEQTKETARRYVNDIKSLTLLEANENKAKDYTKIEGLKLTENGHRFANLIKH